MALTNNGTIVQMDASYLPTGYTKPTVTRVTDYEASFDSVVVTIAKSTVENANKVTTFTALVAAVTAAVSALITADFNVSGLAVTAYANLKRVYHNLELTGVLYTNGAVNYVCEVDYFVKTEAL